MTMDNGNKHREESEDVADNVSPEQSGVRSEDVLPAVVGTDLDTNTDTNNRVADLGTHLRPNTDADRGAVPIFAGSVVREDGRNERTFLDGNVGPMEEVVFDIDTDAPSAHRPRDAAKVKNKDSIQTGDSVRFHKSGTDHDDDILPHQQSNLVSIDPNVDTEVDHMDSSNDKKKKKPSSGDSHASKKHELALNEHSHRDAQSNNDRQSHKRNIVVVVLVAGIVVGLILGLVLLVGKDNNSDSSNNIVSPDNNNNDDADTPTVYDADKPVTKPDDFDASILPTQRQRFIHMIVGAAISDSRDFISLDTPQGQAVSFLAYVDSNEDNGVGNNGLLEVPQVISNTDNFHAWMSRYALLVLYFSTGGQNSWTRNDNYAVAQTSICEWHGVTCANGNDPAEPALISALDLSDNNLAGMLPDRELIYLSKFLDAFDVSSNPALRGTLDAACVKRSSGRTWKADSCSSLRNASPVQCSCCEC